MGAHALVSWVVQRQYGAQVFGRGLQDRARILYRDKCLTGSRHGLASSRSKYP